MEDGRKAAIGVGLVAVVAGILLLTAWKKKPEEPPEPPPGTSNLYGLVTDAETGEPIAGITGTVYQDKGTETWSYDFTTDSSGYYFIDNMLPDADLTQMVIYATGYATYTNEDVPISEGNNELSVQMVPE